VSVQDQLDFDRVDVLTTADDHVLLAVHQRDETLGVLAGQVTGVEPATPLRLSGDLGKSPVAGEDVGPPQHQFTHLAHLDILVLLIDDSDICVQERSPHRSRVGAYEFRLEDEGCR